jgi:hypothetical protein
MASESDQAARQAASAMSTFLRRLLGASRGSATKRLTSTSVPHGAAIGGTATTQTTPRTLPRQLSSESYTTRTRNGGDSHSGWAALLRPVSGVVGLLSGLFGGGSTTTRTRYREVARQPFNIVAAISPETHSAIAPLNESAAGLRGVAAPARETSLSASLMNDRQAVVSAVRRSLGESRAITDVLSEYQDGL